MSAGPVSSKADKEFYGKFVCEGVTVSVTIDEVRLARLVYRCATSPAGRCSDGPVSITCCGQKKAWKATLAPEPGRSPEAVAAARTILETRAIHAYHAKAAQLIFAKMVSAACNEGFHRSEFEVQVVR